MQKIKDYLAAAIIGAGAAFGIYIIVVNLFDIPYHIDKPYLVIGFVLFLLGFAYLMAWAERTITKQGGKKK